MHRETEDRKEKWEEEGREREERNQKLVFSGTVIILKLFFDGTKYDKVYSWDHANKLKIKHFMEIVNVLMRNNGENAKKIKGSRDRLCTTM